MTVLPLALDPPKRVTYALRPVVVNTLRFPPLARYGVAIAASVAAILFSLWLGPRWISKFPFVVIMPVVMLSGWFGGFGPGLLSTLLLAAAALYYWIEPVHSWAVNERGDLLALVMFVLVGAVISALNEAWRRSIAVASRSEEQLRIALGQEREAHEKLARTADELRQLQLITEAALSTQSSEQLMGEMLRRIRAALHSDTASILLVDANGQHLVPVASDGIEAEVGAGTQVPIGRGLAGRIALSEGPLRLEDLRNTEVLSPILRREVRSLIGTALKVDKRLVGVIHAGSATARTFSDAEAQLLSLAADRIALAIERARLQEAERAARIAAETADRQKDEFLALLGHELRNPLAPIGTATELLARTLPVDSGAQLALDIIKRQATQLARLVDDLLDVGRIAQGRIQLQQMPLELASVIAQAVETVQPKLRQKQQSISILTSEDPLYVRGDFARLVQCVQNILTNAVKYTERHGKIRIETRADGEMVVIGVSDNGVGIPEDLLPKVFDLFVQGDRTLDRAEGGLGIGLAVVKKLIHMHCGEVTAESAGTGKGTTFQIRLPRIAQPATIKSPAFTSVNVSPRRILIVDDNADFARSLAKLLSTAGHQIVVVFGGGQALEAIESFQPEVALVDIGLPEMNGYELALRLRADTRLNGVKLVAVTGYGLAEDRQTARTAGFDHHLLKPIDIAALERILASKATEAADELVDHPWVNPNSNEADGPRLSV